MPLDMDAQLCVHVIGKQHVHEVWIPHVHSLS